MSKRECPVADRCSDCEEGGDCVHEPCMSCGKSKGECMGSCVAVLSEDDNDQLFVLS